MASPVGRPDVQGAGLDQFKAVVMGWIRDEIGKAAQGGAGLHVDGATGNLIIDRGEVQSGNYAPGTAGWVLQPGGGAEFSGAVTIDGSLTIASGLLQGITYVELGSIGLSQTPFTVPTTMTAVASGVLTVPVGFTGAAILGIVSVGAWNGSASGGYLYAQAYINGSPGATLPVYAGPSSYGTVPASAIRTLSGLTGGSTIPVAVRCQAAGGWGSDASNIANIDVIAIFTR